MNAADRKAALHRFAAIRFQAMDLMKLAAEIEGIPAHYKAQADAVAGLCATKLANIYGDPDAEDFLAIRDDIETIANKIDPLLLAIGKHAKANSSVVDLSQFTDVVRGATDGNATFTLTEASEDAEYSSRELEAAE